MKPIVFIVISFLFAHNLLAQDNIVMRNGEEIKAKVQEVGLKEIKYKKADNLNGPVYTVLKTDVFIIKYENGSKEVFGSAEEAPAAAPIAESKEPPLVREQRREREPRHERERRVEYQQDHKPGVKKIVGGAIMTGFGIPVLAGGVTLLTVGASAFEATSTRNPIADGFSVGLVAVGSVITAGGIVIEVLGPITLSRGIKEHRGGVSMNFSPIYNPGLDRYNYVLNRQTIGAVSFTF